MFNPIIYGWIGYFGIYCKTSLYAVLRYFNKTLVAWAMRKYKQFYGKRKKAGLFIPTPGQTEQEYLSWYYEKNGWFFSQSQYRLDLPGDISIARKYAGFPEMPSTEENIRHLYDNLLAGYLE